MPTNATDSTVFLMVEVIRVAGRQSVRGSGTLDGMAENPKSPMTVAELRRALAVADPEAIVFVVVTGGGYRLPNPEDNDEVGHPFDVEVADDAPVVYLRPCRHPSKLRGDGL